tara:strand:- start:10713 stop:11597 length:885 start_codon:yes stop_codon:yes gene_type:complete
MDLYGSGASISQANAQTNEARQLSRANQDFNNSLAEQLDTTNLELDQDKQSKLNKNILSGATNAGKLGIISKNKMLGGKEIKTSLAERMAKDPDRLARNSRAATAARAEGVAPRAPVEATAGEVFEGEKAGTRLGSAAVEGGEVAGVVGSSGAARGLLKVAESGVGKSLLKVGKVGVAGLGGGLDIAQDIGNLASGKSGMEVFGSNTASRFGNIANILGSGLEVAGVATGGITPWSLTLEAAGAGIGLLGSLAEAGGEMEASDDAKKTADTDITSQERGAVLSSNVETSVARSN